MGTTRIPRCRTLPLLVFLVTTASMAVWILSLAGTRNSFFEFCTTRAYGHPFPWRVDWCLCAKGRPAVNPAWWFMNTAVILTPGCVLWFVWTGVLRRRRHVLK
ncbi:MAG: hypothetical protein JW889_14065 [Verrucomicrobia bacterium]|nr:hypothetical protein [Verrucomicrobiota bacterium]